jgi:hypothetical protein
VGWILRNRQRVEITLVCVEITVVSVVITFVRVKITLRVEIITLCVLKSHNACEHHTMRVTITLCV